MTSRPGNPQNSPTNKGKSETGWDITGSRLTMSAQDLKAFQNTFRNFFQKDRTPHSEVQCWERLHLELGSNIEVKKEEKFQMLEEQDPEGVKTLSAMEVAAQSP